MRNRLAPQLALVALLLLPLAPSLCAEELAPGDSEAAAFEQAVTAETVKTGDYSRQWQPSWSALRERLIIVNPALVLTALLAVLLILGLLAALRVIFASPKAQRPAAGQKSGAVRRGLRFKLTLFAIALAVLVFGMAYAPVFCIMHKTQQEALLQITPFIALAVLALGILAALWLSLLIVLPIQKLLRHVETIRDAEDMGKFVSASIRITSRDEIATLSNTINEMTQRLARAAVSARDISVGRELQKKFLPLEIDSNGNKLSSGYMDAKNAVFFGYYEGARGISGDYFDYKDLDGRYYAIIKCDIAGKGIPAALLMVQVATMFLNYFKDWKPQVKGMRIEEAVYQINSFIETLGFKGRFAAFTLCLFDSETGDLHFCNAGDNIIHICDSSEKCFKSITLPATPAAGALPNSMVEAKGGYQVQTITLDRNDILLLYTDGIEESKLHDEELGTQRVKEIVNAVLNQQTYTLHKRHGKEEQEELLFDYSGCRGKVEEVIMALIAAEKMFRCYRHPGATENDRVLVDKKIDSFLKNHFPHYHSYCTPARKHLGNNSYLYYTHLMESEQYDDLSILGIKRK